MLVGFAQKNVAWNNTVKDGGIQQVDCHPNSDISCTSCFCRAREGGLAITWQECIQEAINGYSLGIWLVSPQPCCLGLNQGGAKVYLHVWRVLKYRKGAHKLTCDCLHLG